MSRLIGQRHYAMLLSDVCLRSVCRSVTYIGPPPNSRTERPRKTKISRGRPRHTWLGHHFQGQKVKGQGHQAALVGCTGRPTWYTVMVIYPYAYMTYIVSPLAGLGGGISWRPPAYRLLKPYHSYWRGGGSSCPGRLAVGSFPDHCPHSLENSLSSGMSQ